MNWLKFKAEISTKYTVKCLVVLSAMNKRITCCNYLSRLLAADMKDLQKSIDTHLKEVLKDKDIAYVYNEVLPKFEKGLQVYLDNLVADVKGNKQEAILQSNCIIYLHLVILADYYHTGCYTIGLQSNKTVNRIVKQQSEYAFTRLGVKMTAQEIAETGEQSIGRLLDYAYRTLTKLENINFVADNEPNV
jgi:hypothetical protein